MTAVRANIILVNLGLLGISIKFSLRDRGVCIECVCARACVCVWGGGGEREREKKRERERENQ